MDYRTFQGPNLPGLLQAVRVALGDDAVVVRTRGPAETDGRNYEVVVAPPGAEVVVRRTTLVPRPRGGPRVIALVGPAGGGKTTAAVKLALHAGAFGREPVGLITLDTYRAAAVEQLDAYAQVAGLPLEVAYGATDVDGALERLSDRATVIVDTPGRSPSLGTDSDWQAALDVLRPDEVHLVIPASMRADVACSMRDAFGRTRPTHVLLTRLDEVVGRGGVRELRELLGLPMRWTSHGPRVPHDLDASAAAGSLLRAG